MSIKLKLENLNLVQMKYFFFFILLSYIYQSEIFAQDLLIVNNNDSIPCKIRDIDADSSVYYKAFFKYDLYNGYLKRDYYSEIIIDYYTKLKRHSNPNNGLGFIDLGIHYTFIPFNPIIDEFIENEKLFTELSNGYTFSISYQKFYNPINKYYYKKRLHTNFSLGLNFEFFRRNVDNSNFQLDDSLNINIKRQFETISLLISYNTKFKYTTYITFKPGLMFNNYLGFYNNTPIESKSTILNMGIGIDQKLLDITKDFSLFLSVDQYFLAVQSGKIEYKRLNYTSTVHYNNWQFDYGFLIGLTVKYFY